MEENEVVRRIREYHIIKDIIESNSVKRLAAKKDAKVSEVLAVFDAYAEFFGEIRIDQFEDFDRFFRRLENNYLADSKHKKVKSSEAGYDIYIRNVLGSKGLKTVTDIVSDEEISAKIKGLSLDVGKHTRESNAIVVARAIDDYSVVSGLRGNLSESIRKNDDLKEDLERIRLVLKVTQRETFKKEDAIKKLDELESALVRVIMENSADSEYLMKAIAKSTGRKINELRNELREAAGDSKNRDESILSEIGGLREETRENSKKLDKIYNNMGPKSVWKKVGYGAGVVGAGIGGLVIGLLLNGQEPAPIPDDSANALAVQSAYVEYMDDFNSLGISFQNMISDGELDQKDAETFDAKVKTFLEKYDGTDFDGRSDADAELIKSLFNSFSTMSDEKKTAVYNYAVLLNDYNIVNANLEEYKVKNEGLISSNAGLQKQYDELQSKVTSLESKIDELKELVTSTENASKIQELLIKIQGLENQVAELNAQVNELTGQNNILQGQVDSLTSENADLKNQVGELNAENETLKAELSEANGLLATAQGQVEVLTKEKAELQAKYEAGALTEKQLREEIAKLEKNEAELGKQVAELTGTIADLNEQLEAKVAEFNELQAKYNELSSKNNALTSENAKIAEDLATAQKTIADLKSQIEATTTESAELILDIYEYITGETTTDLAHAMQVLVEQLGLTTVTPSTPGVENNVKQPE